jgi:hypothetical protein
LTWMLRMPWAEVYIMGGMLKGIDCLQLRFSEFVTIYAFCILSLDDGVAILESYRLRSLLLATHTARLVKATKLN